MLRKCKEFDYPKWGKAIIILVATIEASVYAYLGVS